MAAMLHACVDFPFFHPGVPGWMFVLLALLYMSRMPDESRQQRARPVISAAYRYRNISNSEDNKVAAR